MVEPECRVMCCARVCTDVGATTKPLYIKKQIDGSITHGQQFFIPGVLGSIDVYSYDDVGHVKFTLLWI